MENNPSVSIIIPTYNEAENIEQVVKNFLNSNYPNLIEILIIDGNSSDRTQEIINQLAKKDNRIKLLLNPHRIQSVALNIGLENSLGDIFLRADAHCIYDKNYVENCVAALLNSKAYNVGGAQRFIATNYWQAGVALAVRSIIGSGGAKYRNPDYNGYAETVFLGCFWKDILLKIGGYAITRKEDSELNYRLLQESERAIYISSDIKVWYFPRKNWRGLWNQYVKYGRGSYIMSTKYPQKLPLRNKIPFYSILIFFIVLLIDTIFFHGSLKTIWAILFASITISLEAARITWKYRNEFDREFWRGTTKEIPPIYSRWFCCLIAILTMPLAHFSGYGYQFFRRTIMGDLEDCFFESKSYIPDRSNNSLSSNKKINV